MFKVAKGLRLRLTNHDRALLGCGLIGVNNNASGVPTLKTLKTNTIVHTFRDNVTIIVRMTWTLIVTVTISVMVSRQPGKLCDSTHRPREASTPRPLDPSPPRPLDPSTPRPLDSRQHGFDFPRGGTGYAGPWLVGVEAGRTLRKILQVSALHPP